MALSMEEQRILTEIASQFDDNDPELAERLATFGRTRRRRRVRLAVATVVFAVAIMTAVVAAVAAAGA